MDGARLIDDTNGPPVFRIRLPRKSATRPNQSREPTSNKRPSGLKAAPSNPGHLPLHKLPGVGLDEPLDVPAPVLFQRSELVIEFLQPGQLFLGGGA